MLLIWLLVFIVSCKDKERTAIIENDYSGWTNYAGTKDGIRYSSNEEITLNNVKNLEVAWRYSSHDKDSLNRSQNQCNPIVVEGVFYGTSPKLKLMALDAATGKPHWVFDPANEDKSLANDPMSFFKVNRGVSYWKDDEGNNKRIFYNVGGKVYAIDAVSGKPIYDFGAGGYIDLSKDLDREDDGSNPFMISTTPGVIYKNKLIIGSRVAESADGAPGHIRAYNVLTGKRDWIFHTIPHPGEIGYDTWPDKDAYKKLGGANNWAGMSVDIERGIVYIPTGSISGDFYGGFREGQNLFANSLIAIEASTGNYLWHFQTVHHDLWDRDLPANPNLVTLSIDGKEIDAVAQISKQGFIFLFDRTSGEPIFPIEEVPVPQESLPGENPWPTQPIPTLPEPFARQSFNEEDVTNIDSKTHSIMLEKYRQVKNKIMFSPPSKDGGWIFPGFDGGGEWGGASVDPETQILYVNSTELPWVMVMVDVPKKIDESGNSKSTGRTVYDKYCFACHGTDLKGNGSSYPSLVDIGIKYKSNEIKNIINNGINMMPAFKQMPENEKDALISFLRKSEVMPKEPTTVTKEPGSEVSGHSKSILDEIPYQMKGYNRFLDDNGYPGITPPWGTLNAVNLNTGKLLWKVPLGEYKELSEKGIPVTGTENYGGSVVTKGGLVFIAATRDSKIRAFDKRNGDVVWEASLPAPGYATPAVYQVNGKQFIVIACGGGKVGSKSGDEYVAFSLP